MPLVLQPVVDTDHARLALVEREAWRDNPHLPVLFPNYFAQTAIDRRVERLEKEIATDPTVTWLKITDTSSDKPEEGIAFAKWNCYVDTPCEDQSETLLGEDCNVEACTLVFGGFQEQKARLLGKRKYIYLHILITHPDHQRRGAGAMLVKWGLDVARKHNLPAYLEAGPVGKGLYLKEGFKVIGVQSIDLSKWGDSEPHVTYAMVANMGDKEDGNEHNA